MNMFVRVVCDLLCGVVWCVYCVVLWLCVVFRVCVACDLMCDVVGFVVAVVVDGVKLCALLSWMCDSVVCYLLCVVV